MWKKIIEDIDPALVALLIGSIVVIIALELMSTNKEPITEVTVSENQVQEVQEAQPEEVELVYEGDEIVMREPEYYEAVDLLARMIHCENSNEVDGEPACWKTGSVAVNRMNDPEYPDTIEGVIRQPGQYDSLSKLYDEEPTDIEYEVSAELLNSGSVLPEDVIYAAEFIQGSGVYDKIGNTYYCYV